MTRYTQKSFTGGELSPALYSRNDLAKYMIGLKTLKNGFVRAEGCISNRAGLEFITEVKNSASAVRLIPFSFNTEQTYIIELGNKYARFIKNAGQIQFENQPVEEETPYITEDLFNIKYAQNADVLTLCHNNYSPCELSRESHYSWNLADIHFQPKILPPKINKILWNGGSQEMTEYHYIVTSVMKDTYEESNCSEIATVKGELESYWGVSDYIKIEFNAVENAVEYNVYRSVNGVYGYIGTTAETSFTGSSG